MDYVVVDVETTGTKPLVDDIIEIGAVYVRDGKVIKEFESLVKPNLHISEYITSITGITNEMVEKAPPIEEVMVRFIAFCEEAVLIGHNLIVFDYRILKVKATRLEMEFNFRALDTLVISRNRLAHLPSRRLGDLCEYYKIDLQNAHRAYDDAYATYELFRCLEQGFKDEAPELFEPKEVEWKIPKVHPITLKQKKYLVRLCSEYNITLEKEVEALTKSEASRTIDKIISEYGRL